MSQPRSSPARFHVTALGVAVLAALAGSAAIVWMGQYFAIQDASRTARFTVAILFVGGLVLLLGRRLAGGRDWFHPLAFPSLYVAFAMMAPLAFILWTGMPVGPLRPTQLHPRVVAFWPATCRRT